MVASLSGRNSAGSCWKIEAPVASEDREFEEGRKEEEARLSTKLETKGTDECEDVKNAKGEL